MAWRGPKPLADIIRKEQNKIWRTSPGLGLQSLWREAAGQEIAAQAAALSLRDGVLTVACSTGGWACELKLHGAALVEKMNALSPPEPVREIRFIHQARGGWKSSK